MATTKRLVSGYASAFVEWACQEWSVRAGSFWEVQNVATYPRLTEVTVYGGGQPMLFSGRNRREKVAIEALEWATSEGAHTMLILIDGTGKPGDCSAVLVCLWDIERSDGPNGYQTRRFGDCEMRYAVRCLVPPRIAK